MGISGLPSRSYCCSPKLRLKLRRFLRHSTKNKVSEGPHSFGFWWESTWDAANAVLLSGALTRGQSRSLACPQCVAAISYRGHCIHLAFNCNLKPLMYTHSASFSGNLQHESGMNPSIYMTRAALSGHNICNPAVNGGRKMSTSAKGCCPLLRSHH